MRLTCINVHDGSLVERMVLRSGGPRTHRRAPSREEPTCPPWLPRAPPAAATRARTARARPRRGGPAPNVHRPRSNGRAPLAVASPEPARCRLRVERASRHHRGDGQLVARATASDGRRSRAGQETARRSPRHPRRLRKPTELPSVRRRARPRSVCCRHRDQAGERASCRNGEGRCPTSGRRLGPSTRAAGRRDFGRRRAAPGGCVANQTSAPSDQGRRGATPQPTVVWRSQLSQRPSSRTIAPGRPIAPGMPGAGCTLTARLGRQSIAPQSTHTKWGC